MERAGEDGRATQVRHRWVMTPSVPASNLNRRGVGGGNEHAARIRSLVEPALCS